MSTTTFDKDKAKQVTANLWTQTKRTAARTKQRALEVLGKADKIVDVQFNQEKERFLEHYKAVEKLNKDCDKVVKLMKELSVAQATLAEDFYLMYESSAALYNAALKNQDASKNIDNSRIQCEDSLKADFMDEVSRYLGQFKEIKDRLAEQDTRRIDVERYARDVKIYQEKNNTAKLATCQPKLEVAKTNYENLTEELMVDMPNLYADRIPFFDPVFATYLSAIAEFHRQASKYTSECVPMVAHVDRAAVHTHERVITPNELSSAHHKVSAISPSSNAYSTNSRASTALMDSPIPSTTPSAPISNTTSTTTSTPTTTRQLPTAPTKPMPTPKKVVKAQALYDFNPQEEGELGFRAGDTLIIHQQNGEWWEGEMNGNKGVLPSNYVQIIN